MRTTLQRLATHTTRARSVTSRPAPLALLPPIHLYRRILRIHRKVLPVEARLLGDEYVKTEFRLHREIDNPVHIVGFLTEWQLYAQQLEGGGWRDAKLDKEKIEKMSDDQIQQLYELMMAVKGGHGEGNEGGESEGSGSPASGAEGSEKA